MLKALTHTLSRAVNGLVAAIIRIPYYLEHTVVLAFESLQRLRWRLDPRLHDEQKRIRQVTEGALRKDAAKFVILVIYAEGPLPSFTMNFVAAVRRSAFNLIVVANSSLTADVRQQLLGNCCLLIERENLGQDFGGYKDGISVVRPRFPEVDRIVLANDSVYYLPDGLDRLLADLNGEHDFIGVSEVFDHHYHVASFLISFGPRVLQSAAFQRFWKRYLPIGTRRWAIFRGEGALTAELLQAGFRPHVLFRAQALKPHLQSPSAPLLSESIALLPAIGRKLMAASLRKIGLREQARELGAVASGNTVEIHPGERQPMVDALIAAIEARNQMHMGGFVFRRLLGLPVIKRDVVFRQVHTREELARGLGDIPAPLVEEILRDAGRRGTTADYNLWLKVLSRHSAA